MTKNTVRIEENCDKKIAAHMKNKLLIDNMLK